MNTWLVAAALGALVLFLVVLHHAVVFTFAGTEFARAFEGTCAGCHGKAAGRS